MRTEVDERLLREAAQYRLRFACEHCAHFAPPLAGLAAGSCSQGYPSDEHRGVTLEIGVSRVFCKMFEAS